jgi:hypothetical protein
VNSSAELADYDCPDLRRAETSGAGNIVKDAQLGFRTNVYKNPIHKELHDTLQDLLLGVALVAFVFLKDYCRRTVWRLFTILHDLAEKNGD